METTPFKPQEIAYRVQNMAGTAKWKRVIKKTQRSFDRFLVCLNEAEAEIQIRDAEGSV